MELKKNKDRLNNVEFLRFVFAVSIVYFHLLHSALMPYTGDAGVYQYLAEQSKYTKYIVECFFIISGYFLYQSIRIHDRRTIGGFICKKVIRLWPVLACSTLISVIFLKKSVYSGIINLFFLQSTGLATDWKGLNWYVSAFFFAEIFYFMLYKAVKNSAGRQLSICLLVYFGYSLNIVTTGGEFGRKIVYGVFSLAMARAVAGVGLGCLIGEGYTAVSGRYRNQKILAGKKIWTLGISALEIGSLFFLMADFFWGKTASENQFLVIIVFSVLFVCMITEKGIFSRIISRSRLCALGKYTYSVYVMQETAFFFLKHTFWKNEVFVQEYIPLCLAVSILAAFFLGVLTYYLVERPVSEKIALILSR